MIDDRYCFPQENYPGVMALEISTTQDKYWGFTVSMIKRGGSETIAYTKDYDLAMVLARSLAIALKVRIKDKCNEHD